MIYEFGPTNWLNSLTAYEYSPLAIEWFRINSNFLNYERKTPIFTIPPRGDGPPTTSETGGESWDPVLKTRRSFQETGIARECTVYIILTGAGFV